MIKIEINLYSVQQMRDALEVIKGVVVKYNCAEFEYTFNEKPEDEWRSELEKHKIDPTAFTHTCTPP